MALRRGVRYVLDPGFCPSGAGDADRRSRPAAVLSSLRTKHPRAGSTSAAACSTRTRWWSANACSRAVISGTLGTIQLRSTNSAASPRGGAGRRPGCCGRTTRTRAWCGRRCVGFDRREEPLEDRATSEHPARRQGPGGGGGRGAPELGGASRPGCRGPLSTTIPVVLGVGRSARPRHAEGVPQAASGPGVDWNITWDGRRKSAECGRRRTTRRSALRDDVHGLRRPAEEHQDRPKSFTPAAAIS